MITTQIYCRGKIHILFYEAIFNIAFQKNYVWIQWSAMKIDKLQ